MRCHVCQSTSDFRRQYSFRDNVGQLALTVLLHFRHRQVRPVVPGLPAECDCAVHGNGVKNGSLLLTILMHATVNSTKDIVPSAMSGATNAFSLNTSYVVWLSVAILWIYAAYFLVRMRGVKLQAGWSRSSSRVGKPDVIRINQ